MENNDRTIREFFAKATQMIFVLCLVKAYVAAIDIVQLPIQDWVTFLPILIALFSTSLKGMRKEDTK